MDGALGVEAAHEADVIDALRDVGEKGRYVAAALAVLAELPGAPQQGRVALGELADDCAVAFRQRLSVKLVEGRLGIESVDLAGAADHEQEDDRLRFAGRSAAALAASGFTRFGCVCRWIKQRCQRDRAEAVCGAHQNVAAGHAGRCGGLRVHRRTRFD